MEQSDTGITFDEIEKTLSPDVAAARCDTYEFKGRKLHGFSKTRQTAACSMGTLVFLGQHNPGDNGNYPEMFSDAQKVVWLCVVDDNMAKKACDSPKTANSLVTDWWSKEGGNLFGPEYMELMQIFGKVLEDIFVVSAETDSTGSGSGDNLGE